MNEKTKAYLLEAYEGEAQNREKKENDPWNPGFHLSPPAGWLNDPNGLCQSGGIYHVFFQYSPQDPCGKGLRSWGHYTSCDLLNWQYRGIFLCPDEWFDRSGAYSGCGVVSGNEIFLFYTGNVKEEGTFDYILAGRQANQVMVLQRPDGTMEKKLLLTNENYPDNYTCHVRDPKVWKHGSSWRMILGGRKKGDRGAALLYESEDLYCWRLKKEITSKTPFGYMWECPDVLSFGEKNFLSFCPQGISREEYRFQNVYQSGYIPLKGDIDHALEADENCFTEWDMGFDFYAPQTFVDQQGRRILIGWMGLPDIEGEYGNPTVERGWQHCLTLPRVITEKKGKLYQNPPAEFLKLRQDSYPLSEGQSVEISVPYVEGEFTELTDQPFSLVINQEVEIAWENGVFTLKFSNESGAGRKTRKAKIDGLASVRVYADSSSVEIFVNDGEFVFTSRYYPESQKRQMVLEHSAGKACLWSLKPMKVCLRMEEKD